MTQWEHKNFGASEVLKIFHDVIWDVWLLGGKEPSMGNKNASLRIIFKEENIIETMERGFGYPRDDS